MHIAKKNKCDLLPDSPNTIYKCLRRRKFKKIWPSKVEINDKNSHSSLFWQKHEPITYSMKKIKVIYMPHKLRYGSLGITRALQAQSAACSHTRDLRRMKQMGLQAVAKRK